MLHDPCHINHALIVLNSMVKADPDAARAFIEQRVPCNVALAEHPTIQVVPEYGPDEELRGGHVGLLGVLNGIFGVDEKGWGPFTAHFDVVCSDTCSATGKDIGELKEGKPCPVCGEPLRCGPLTHFSRTKHKED